MHCADFRISDFRIARLSAGERRMAVQKPAFGVVSGGQIRSWPRRRSGGRHFLHQLFDFIREDLQRIGTHLRKLRAVLLGVFVQQALTACFTP